MGLSKFREWEIFNEILRRGKYWVGDDGAEDLVITHIKMLLDKSGESYMQGAIDGFAIGQIKEKIFKDLQESAKIGEK